MQPTEQLSRLYAVFHAAKALVSILGPIYLMQLGFDLQAVLLYCMLTAVVKVSSLFVVFPLAARYSARVTMLIGTAMMALHFVWFAWSAHDMTWLVVLAATLGVANAFFYPSFRINFSLATTHKKTSRHVARLNNYTTAATAIAPVIGGVMASYIDIRLTYLCAATLFALAAYQAYTFAPAARQLSFRFARVPRGGALRDYVANSSYSFSGLADLAVWPLYLALIVPTYAGLGLYAGFVVAVAILVQWLVGRASTLQHEKLALYGGVLLNFVYNAGRGLATSVAQLVGLGFVNALGGALLSGAYGGRFYKNIDPKRHLEYLFGMELANSVTWLVYFPILLWMSTTLDYEQTLRAGVLLVMPAVLGMLLMRIFTVRQSHQATR